MKKIFAISFDGFVQDSRYDNLEEVRTKYNQVVKNTNLYQYDCCVVELDEKNNIQRRVSYQELTAV